ncbi:MAG: hypothetical protein E7608_03895 [Ruminococcaceae bacterium]|nr:hypothetical protein [Oscillospiraceae bacterium]
MTVTKEMGVMLPHTTMNSPVYLDVKNAPFKLYGFDNGFERVPADIAKATSEKVECLARTSAGGRVRFRTNSDYIVVHGDYDYTENSTVWSIAAQVGFDIYFTENGKQRFKGVFAGSKPEGQNYSENRLRFTNEMKDVTIYFPMVTAFTSFYIGLHEGCEIEAVDDYKYETPVVFYGSSIVHGVGAGRASNSYPSIISRRLDCNYRNLGFGGAAKAEKPIMEYIAGLDMSVFVYDYDHNAPDYEHLLNTHYEGYKIFRAKQPKTPVIMASRVDINCGNRAENEKCRALIRSNYERAKAEGDENIYFIDGEQIYPDSLRDECTCDGCHPNDMGYSYMADAFGKIIKELIEK